MSLKEEISRCTIHKICRTCLEVKADMQPLSKKLKLEGNKTVCISDILISISPEFSNWDGAAPNLICKECVNLAKTSYLFKLKFEGSIAIINNFLANELTFKIEIVDDEIDVAVLSDEDKYVSPTKDEKLHTNGKGNIKTSKIATSIPEQKGNKIMLHSCPICIKEFSALDLKKHVQSHRSLRKYLSIPIKTRVSSSSRFYTSGKEENESFFNKINKLHKCPYCNLEFKITDFIIHIESHDKEEDFKCDQCERVFRKVNHLNMHRIKHMKEYPYKCEHCKKGFVIKNNYDCHVLTHKNDVLPHECSYCLKRFSNPEHLNRHQIIHTEKVSYGLKYKVCRCYHCLRTFKDRDDLAKHPCIPTDKNPNLRYSCKTCNKVFKHPSGLYNHHRQVHKLKGAKVLCSVCGSYVANIYTHMLRHTGEKRYECNQCEKKFLAKPQLRQHLLVHSGLKPYVCSQCGKAFNNLYNLQVHERIHKGDRCHVCTTCNRGFLEKSYLRKHMKVHIK